MTLTEEERKARKTAYMREYRNKNRDRVNAIARKCYENNPVKAAEAQARYWLKKAAQLRQEGGDK